MRSNSGYYNSSVRSNSGYNNNSSSVRSNSGYSNNSNVMMRNCNFNESSYSNNNNINNNFKSSYNVKKKQSNVSLMINDGWNSNVSSFNKNPFLCEISPLHRLRAHTSYLPVGHQPLIQLLIVYITSTK